MNKTVKIILISVIAVIVTAIITLVTIEQASKRSYTIVNNTDKNITALGVMFEREEDGVALQMIYEGALNSGEKQSGKFETASFGEDGAELGIVVTFDGSEEIYCYDGYFVGSFDGKIDLEFYKTEGEYRLKSNASVGIFKNTDNTSLEDSEIVFDLEANDWDYVDYDGEFEDFDDDMFEIIDEDDEDWDDEDDEDWDDDDEDGNAFEFHTVDPSTSGEASVSGTVTE